MNVSMASWKERAAKKIKTVAHGQLRVRPGFGVAQKAAELVIRDRGGEVRFSTGGGAVFFRTWK